MADQRDGGIAWTDATWNPTRGCSRVSEGCRNCYAEGVARRFSGPGQPYEGLVRLSADGKAKAQWNGVVRLVPEHLGDPLRWQRPRRVFVNSMSDLFHESLAFDEIAAVFGVMASASRHTFQVLTKRPARAAEFFAWLGDDGDAQGRMHNALGFALQGGEDWDPDDRHCEALLDADVPLPNVWLGVSVEDQATADERIPALLSLPAAVRFVSYEPALGPVNFRLEWLAPFVDVTPSLDRTPRLDWVIVGGESGHGARPFDLWWARTTVRQCADAGVACFVKQLGAHPVAPVCDPEASNYGQRLPFGVGHRAGADPAEWPSDLRVREFPR
jgi:protein gp37